MLPCNKIVEAVASYDGLPPSVYFQRAYTDIGKGTAGYCGVYSIVDVLLDLNAASIAGKADPKTAMVPVPAVLYPLS
jgi:hypothetical protein